MNFFLLKQIIELVLIEKNNKIKIGLRSSLNQFLSILIMELEFNFYDKFTFIFFLLPLLQEQSQKSKNSSITKLEEKWVKLPKFFF